MLLNRVARRLLPRAFRHLDANRAVERQSQQHGRLVDIEAA
ncbi:hypothetical protein [Alcanivorax hongdengensis]|nr:hypothetical protein [Alcanivorax hongdengensis]